MALSTARSSARRRQRSTRLTVAVALLVCSALLVAACLATGSLLLVSSAAAVAVVLGAAGTRITHSELVQTRRDWARDRARQAQEYRTTEERRVAQHREYVAHMTGRAEQRERELTDAHEALVVARARSAEATRRLNAEARRAELAEQHGVEVGRQLEESEQRAAEAIVRLAELEQEVDVLRAEVRAWQELDAPMVRHA